MRDKTSKQYPLLELVQDLEVSLAGDSSCLIEGVCTIQDGLPGHITFLMNPLYKKFLATTQAAAVILLPEDAKDFSGCAVLAKDPYYTYTQIARYFDDRPTPKPDIHPTVVIGKHCQLADSVSIGPNCVIGDGVTLDANVVLGPGCVIDEGCEVGAGTRLDAKVVLYHRVKLGKNVCVSSGTVIGSDGFGIAKHKGVWHKVPQLGTVIIEDDVEIGSNCTIDRGAIENTVIGKGSKLDNLIQVGHNVRIGEHTAIAGCVGISGSTTIGDNCLIGGGTGFAGHLTIADNVSITGGTAVTKSIKSPGIYSSGVGGLVSNLEWRKNSARVQRLGQLNEKVKALETMLKLERNKL